MQELNDRALKIVAPKLIYLYVIMLYRQVTFFKKENHMYNSEYSMQSNPAQFMYKVYGWMAFGLGLSALLAYYVSSVPALADYVLQNPMLILGLFIMQICIAVGLSFFILKINYATALTGYLLYTASIGVTMATLFMVYTLGSIFATFLVTAGMFGVMAIYGYYTQADLTAVGSMGRMALIGLIIGFVVNMYFKNPLWDYILSAIGVVIFTLLTAYDVQKLKEVAAQVVADHETMRKIAVLGAFVLYLDFINLFLVLLRFLGKRRE